MIVCRHTTGIFAITLLMLSRSLMAQQTPCPSFIAPPSSVRKCITEGATLTAQFSATGNSWAWEYYSSASSWVTIADGVNTQIGGSWSGATTGTLTVTDVAAANISNFNMLQVRCKATVTNTSCGTNGAIYSPAAGITFNSAVGIASAPSSRTICKDSPLDLAVIASGGGPYKYTWKRGQLEVGGDSAVYLLKKVQPLHSGTYTVKVENACSSSQIQTFNILVLDEGPPVIQQAQAATATAPPVLSGQPVDFLACLGGGAVFKVIAAGGVGGYQWRYSSDGGANWVDFIPDAQGDVFINTVPVVPPVPPVRVVGYKTNELRLQSINAGVSGYQFKCVLSGTCTYTTTPVTTNVVTLTVDDVPKMGTALVDQGLCVGAQLSMQVVISPGRTGSLYRYRWSKLGITPVQVKPPPVPGDPTPDPLLTTATNDSYNVSGLTRTHSGVYEVTVSNTCGSIKSTARLTVKDAPRVTAVDENICSLTDYKPTYKVAIPDDGPYTATWSRNGKPLAPPQTTNYGSSSGSGGNVIINNPNAKLLEVVNAQPNLAYSLRKLRSDYTGNAFKLRRASDNATQDIGFTAAGTVDTDACRTFLNIDRPSATRGFIETWYDQSPSGWNATQIVQAQQPELVFISGIATAKSFGTFYSGTPPATRADGSDGAIIDIPAGVTFADIRAINFSATTTGSNITGGSYTVTGFANDGTSASFGLEIMDGNYVKLHIVKIQSYPVAGAANPTQLKLTVDCTGYVDMPNSTPRINGVGQLTVSNFCTYATPAGTNGYVKRNDAGGTIYGANLVFTALKKADAPEVKFDGADDFLDVGKSITTLTKAPATGNTYSLEGSVFSVMKAAGSPAPAFGTRESGKEWAGNPANATNNVGLQVLNTTASGASAVTASNWGQYSFLKGSNMAARTNLVERGTGTLTAAITATTTTFTLGKANGNGMATKDCSMKEFIMYPQEIVGRDLNTLEVSQAAYCNAVTGNISIAGDLNLASDYNYQGGTTQATGVLDASCAPYSVLGKLVTSSTSVVIRPFIPTDLSSKIKQWIDFTDESQMVFDGFDSFGNKTFNRIKDKSGNPNPNANAYYNSDRVIFSPRFANGRMESWDANTGGKILKTDFQLNTANGWSFFYTGGYTQGVTRQQRIFDAQQIPNQPQPNVLFGFHGGGVGGIHWGADPGAYGRGFAKDADMHIFAARQSAATIRTNAAMIQDWDNKPRQAWPASLPQVVSMTINGGVYRNGEWTDNFALNEVIATDALPDDEYEKLRAYTAWHAGLQANLPTTNPYTAARPLITLPATATWTYDVVVGNACGTWDPPTTVTVTVAVGQCSNAVILAAGQPQDKYLCARGTTSFKVNAQNATSYRWQYSTDLGSSSWKEFNTNSGEIAQFTSAAIGQAPTGPMWTTAPNNSADGWRTTGSYVLGNTITVRNTVTVTHLGAVVRAGVPIKNAEMGIWDSNGNLVASAFPPPARVGTNGASTIVNGVSYPYEIVYSPLSNSVELTPDTYRIARQLDSEPFLQLTQPKGPIIEITPDAIANGVDISFGNSVYRSSSTPFSAPTTPVTSNWFTTAIKVVYPVPDLGDTRHSGIGSSTLTVSNSSPLPAVRYYRCLVSGGSTTDTPSDKAALYMNEAPLEVAAATDSVLHESYAVCTGGSASLKFNLKWTNKDNKTALGGGPVTYIWTRSAVVGNVAGPGKEVRRFIGTDFSDTYVESRVTGDDPSTTDVVETNTTSYNYTVKALNACAGVTSGTSLNVVLTSPKVTAHPTDIAYCRGASVTMNASSDPASAPSYTWYRLNPTSGIWETVIGNNVTGGQNTKTLTFSGPSRLTFDKTQYRCLLQNQCGQVFTAPATLTVRTKAPVITSNPADLSLCVLSTTGSQAVGAFTVKADEAQGFRWVKINNDATETDLVDNPEVYPGVYTGASTQSLIFYPSVADPTKALNGTRYKCYLTNNCPAAPATIFTPAVTLNFTPAAPSSPLANIAAQVVCSGDLTTPITFAGNNVTTYLWMNDSNPQTRLPTNGNTSGIPAFVAYNNTNAAITDEIRVIPVNGACVGAKNVSSTSGGNFPKHTAGDLVTSITVNPLPTMTANFVNTAVCSSDGPDNNVECRLTNRSLNVPDTKYNWDITQIDGTTNTAPTPAATGSAITAPNTNISESTPGAYTFKGVLTNSSLHPIDVLYKFYPTHTIGIKTCKGNIVEASIRVKPIPVVNTIPDQPDPATKPAFCHGENIPETAFSTSPGALNNITYKWENKKIAIGLSQSGTGNILPFTAVNVTKDSLKAIIKVTPTADGCTGIPQRFSITTAPKPTMQVTGYLPSLCSGATPDIVLKSSPTDVANTAFTWTVAADATVTGPGTTEQTTGVSTPSNSPAASTTYKISRVLNNSSNSAQEVTYHFTPVAYKCTGQPVDIKVKVLPIPTASASQSQEVCSGERTNIPLSNPNNVVDTYYTWTVVANSVQGAYNQMSGVPGPIAQKLSNPTTGPASAEYEVTPQSNGCVGPKLKLTVTINPLPNVTVNVRKPKICTGSLTDVGLSSLAGAKYTWTVSRMGITGGADQTTPTDVNTIAQTFDLPGLLNGMATFLVSAVSEKGCTSSEKATARVIVTRAPGEKSASPDKTFCDDTYVELAADVDSENPFTMQWEESQDRGFTWHTLTEGTPYAGVTSKTLLINPVPSSFSGNKYRLAMNDNICPMVYAPSTPTITGTFGSASPRASATQIKYGDKIVFTVNLPPPGTTYKWDFGDGWTSTLGRPEHYYYPVVGLEGPYHVTLEAFANNYGCKKKFDVADIVVNRPKDKGGDIVTQNAELAGAGVIAFPSPFHHQLTVKSDKAIETIDIIDMRGSVVLTMPVSGAVQAVLPVSSLSPGIYILRIGNAKGEHRIKVTKE